jgi:PAS domain S-box-containing protein
MGDSIDMKLEAAIAKKAHVGFLVLDESRKVVFANEIMECYTGYRKEEILRTRFFELILEDEKYLDVCRMRLENIRTRPFDDIEIPIIKKNKDKAVLRITGSTFEESGETFAMLVISDITRRREYDKVLEAVYDGLMQSTIDLDAELKRVSERNQLLEDYKEVAEQMLVENENEISTAVDIQRRLLPQSIPRMRNTEVEVLYEPVRKLSGDYYDLFPLPGSRLGIVICDVTGIGIPAAFVMIMIRSMVHLSASSGLDVNSMLEMVNRGVIGEIDIEHFATMSMLVYDCKSNEISYSNAGHNPLIVYRKDAGRFESVDTEGFPIGVIGPAEYSKTVFKVSAGDIIALFTNGVIQAVNGKNELYTLDRLLKCLETNANLPLKEITDIVNRDIRSFTGSARQHSDKTLVLVRVGENRDTGTLQASPGELEEIDECPDEEWTDAYKNLVEEIMRHRGTKT